MQLISWLAKREKGHLDICVNVVLDLAVTALYDSIRFCAEVDLL